jgi:dynein heavy chain
MFNFMHIVCYVEYRFDCPNVYIALDKSNDAIRALEIEMATLAEQASLFDVNVPDFKQLKMCRKDVKMLKV